MLNQDSLPAKIFRSCIAAAIMLPVIGVQPVPVEAMTEATYYKDLKYDENEDGYYFEEGCASPAGDCYIVEG